MGGGRPVHRGACELGAVTRIGVPTSAYWLGKPVAPGRLTMTTPTNFVTRSQWGSSFDYSGNTRMPLTCRGVALHWEGSGMGTFTHDLCDNKVRQIENYHVDAKGWAGIAYNALVCPHGYIYEGRGIRYRSAANGDPTKNNAYFAVCYLGGQGDPFTTDAKGGYVRAVKWLRSDGGAGDYVIGHRDVTATACPGDTIEAWLKAYDFNTSAPSLPTAPVWGKPETWVLGGKSPDVLKMGQRINAWNAVNNLPTWEPDDIFSTTEVKALSELQSKVFGFGSDPEDLARGGASDGFPGALTFANLDKTPTTPAPELEPITLKVLLLPTAGYNGEGARGVTQWERNTKGLAALVNQHDPDQVGVTEMSNRHINPMLPLFTSLVPDYQRGKGSDGRYTFGREATTNPVASGWGNVSDASELNDDDKQFAWRIDEVAPGVNKGLIVVHTENQDGVDWGGANKGADADDLRVAQTMSALGRALAAMRPYGITEDDVIYVGDFNSEGMVKNAMVAKGWKPIGPGYFTRWDDSARKTYDWGFIKAGVATSVRINHDFADHTALLITWKTPR